MTDAQAEFTPPPPPKESGNKPFDILNGRFGFHFSVDRQLETLLQHGLLSRMEERARGLEVRTRASRSDPSTLYFTTRANDIYFRNDSDLKNLPMKERLRDVFAIVIQRPDFAYKREGWFGVQNEVKIEDMRALMFMDRDVEVKPHTEQRDGYDKFKTDRLLPQEEVEARVDFLRKACEKAGLYLPVYGISGDLYWPERKVHETIRRTNSTRP